MNGKTEVLDDDQCVDEKPEATRECTLRPCEGVDWITSSWSGVRQFFSYFDPRKLLVNFLHFDKKKLNCFSAKRVA